jgi:ABC-type Fe3+-citrate transport system substrate-binding protein
MPRHSKEQRVSPRLLFPKVGGNPLRSLRNEEENPDKTLHGVSNRTRFDAAAKQFYLGSLLKELGWVTNSTAAIGRPTP